MRRNRTVERQCSRITGTRHDSHHKRSCRSCDLSHRLRSFHGVDKHINHAHGLHAGTEKRRSRNEDDDITKPIAGAFAELLRGIPKIRACHHKRNGAADQHRNRHAHRRNPAHLLGTDDKKHQRNDRHEGIKVVDLHIFFRLGHFIVRLGNIGTDTFFPEERDADQHNSCRHQTQDARPEFRSNHRHHVSLCNFSNLRVEHQTRAHHRTPRPEIHRRCRHSRLDLQRDQCRNQQNTDGGRNPAGRRKGNVEEPRDDYGARNNDERHLAQRLYQRRYKVFRTFRINH